MKTRRDILRLFGIGIAAPIAAAAKGGQESSGKWYALNEKTQVKVKPLAEDDLTAFVNPANPETITERQIRERDVSIERLRETFDHMAKEAEVTRNALADEQRRYRRLQEREEFHAALNRQGWACDGPVAVDTWMNVECEWDDAGRLQIWVRRDECRRTALDPYLESLKEFFHGEYRGGVFDAYEQISRDAVLGSREAIDHLPTVTRAFFNEAKRG